MTEQVLQIGDTALPVTGCFQEKNAAGAAQNGENEKIHQSSRIDENLALAIATEIAKPTMDPRTAFLQRMKGGVGKAARKQ